MSWDYFEEVALGVLSIPKSEYRKMTFRELDNAVRGYRKRVDERDRMHWEMVRVTCFYTMYPHLKQGSLKKFIDVKIPIDEPEATPEKIGKAKQLTREELKEQFKKSGFEISEEELDRIYG